MKGETKVFALKEKLPRSNSTRGLIIFVTAFAVIGAYFLFSSFAATPVIATLQAEQMTPPAGASILSDSTASGGQAVKLTQNGSLTGSVTLPSTATSLSVVAKGTKCRDSNPRMTVLIDGQTVIPATRIQNQSWQTFSSSSLNLATGTHSLSINYTNANIRNCANPLYVDVTNFYGTPPPPPPAPTVSISTTPTTVSSGQSATLTWASTNATACSASGAWSGNEPTSGSISTGALNQTSTYSLTCTGSGGMATGSATVTVQSGGPGTGPTYYVSTSGNDANSGSQASPWRTIGHAANAVTTPGSTVVILGGTYNENVNLSHSGSSGSAISLTANGTDVVNTTSFTVSASYVTISKLNISGASGDCITINPSLSNITITGNQIHNCGRDGIHFARPGIPPSSNYTSNSTVSNNKIYSVGLSNSEGNNMTIYANYLTVQGNELTSSVNDVFDIWGDHLTFRQNNIHDISNTVGNHNDVWQSWTGLNSSGGICTPGPTCNDGSEGNGVTNLLIEQNKINNVLGSNAHGFVLEGPGHSNWNVRSNTFSNIGSKGAIVGKSVAGCTGPSNLNFYNNTFYSVGAEAVTVGCQGTGSFINNIIMNSSSGYGCWGGGCSVKEGYNLFYNVSNVLSGTGDKVANPLLVNPAGGDFHETSSSPSIDHGDNGSLIPVRPYDYDGHSIVNSVDIGAYEYY